MDEWESVERKLKELQTTFLRKGSGVPPASQSQFKDNVPAPTSDFWKQRFEQEKRLWEEKMASKNKEHEQMQEKLVMEAQSTLELNLKIEALMRQFESALVEWEENPKIKLLESELARHETESGEKIRSLTEENERLKEEIVKREK